VLYLERVAVVLQYRLPLREDGHRLQRSARRPRGSPCCGSRSFERVLSLLRQLLALAVEGAEHVGGWVSRLGAVAGASRLVVATATISNRGVLSRRAARAGGQLLLAPYVRCCSHSSVLAVAVLLLVEAAVHG